MSTDAGRDAHAYLQSIAGTSFRDVHWTRDTLVATRDFLGPWNHNIRLPFGVYTAACDAYYPAHRELLAIVAHALDGAFAGRRILDVGCLEGYFSIECALQGADVLGIDGKTLNVRKCEFVQSALGVPNVRFVEDDAMAVTRDTYGTFDAVLALGLLYHLEDPFEFLANMADVCDGFMLIDTHVALEEQPESIKGVWKPTLSDIRTFEARGARYQGRLFREFDPGTSQVAKDLSPTASLRNESSVWLTEDSLVRLLHDVGFEQVSRLVYANDEGAWWSDPQTNARVLLLAVRRRRTVESRVFPSLP